MADVEMTAEVSPTDTLPSVEVKGEVAQAEQPEEEVEDKPGAADDSENEIENENENENDNDGDNDAPGDNEDEAIEVTDLSDGKISNDLYKTFKAITEVLLNFKIKGRGNE